MSVKKRTPLSPQEAAEARATRIAALRAQINKLEGELATETDELVKWVEQTGQEEFEALKAVKRFNPAKLVGDGFTPGELAAAKEQLMGELPDFVKRDLDFGKMYNALKTNPQVTNALDARNLSLVRTYSWSFRVNGEKD